MTTQEFEAAVLATGQATSQAQVQNAIEFLNQWQNDDALIRSLTVLDESQVGQAQFIASLVIKNRIAQLWSKLNHEDQDQFIGMLCRKISQVHIETAMNLLEALAVIALFDISAGEKWDSFVISPPEDSPIAMALLAVTLKRLRKSKIITEARRQNLRNYFRGNRVRLLARLSAGMANNDMALWSLKAYRNYIPIIGVRHQRSIIDLLLTTFAPANQTRKAAVACLRELFLTYSDTDSRLQRSLLQFFVHGKMEDQSPITRDPNVIEFMIMFLTQYMPPLLCDRHAPCEQDLGTLINVLLSLPHEFVRSHFWNFWSISLGNAVEGATGGPFQQKLYRFFCERLDAIRASLFGYLECAADDGILRNVAAEVWARLSELDYEGMIRFLVTDQDVSPNLCYGIGSMMMIRASSSDMVHLTGVVQGILDRAKSIGMTEEGIDFLLAAVWGLSNAVVFLRGSNLFDIFFEGVLLECLQCHDERVVYATVSALNHISKTNGSMITKSEGSQFLETLTGLSELYANLELRSRIEIYPCVTRMLIDKAPPQRNALFLELWSPLLESIGTGNPDLVQQGLGTIAYTASECPEIMCECGGILWDPLIGLAQQIIPNQGVQPDFVSSLLETLRELMKVFPFEAVSGNIERVVSICLSRNELLPCFFEFLGGLRRQYSEMNRFEEDISSQFLQPALQLPSPPMTEIIGMIAEFQYTKLGVEWFMSVACDCLRSWDLALNKVTIKCLIRVFREETFDFMELMRQFALDLCTSIFTALTDAMHKEILDSYIKLLLKMCIFAGNGKRYGDDWSNMLLQAFQTAAQEPQPGFYVKVIDAMNEKQERMKKKEFVDLMRQVLLMMNRVSPGDVTELFGPHFQPHLPDDDMMAPVQFW